MVESKLHPSKGRRRHNDGAFSRPRAFWPKVVVVVKQGKMLVDDSDQVIVDRFGDIVWEKDLGPGAFVPPDPGDVDVILDGTRQEAAQGVLMVLKFSIELLVGGFTDFMVRVL
jgi:hypothetical protein